MEHVNQQGKIIDFGPVRTDGSVLIERESSEWVARTYPRDRAFTLLLAASRFGQPGRDPLRRRSRPVDRTDRRGCLLEAAVKRRKPV